MDAPTGNHGAVVKLLMLRSDCGVVDVLCVVRCNFPIRSITSSSLTEVHTGTKPALVEVRVHTGTKPARLIVLLGTGTKPAVLSRASGALDTAKLVSVVVLWDETNLTDFFFRNSVGQSFVVCHRLPHVSQPEEPWEAVVLKFWTVSA